MWLSVLFSKKYAPYTVGAILLIVAVVAVFLWGRATKETAKVPKPIKLPQDGQGIPPGWSAVGAANSLYAAMSGWGTDETTINSILLNASPDQVAAIYNEFNNQFGTEYPGCDLICWLRDDLSSDELAIILPKFNGIV